MCCNKRTTGRADGAARLPVPPAHAPNPMAHRPPPRLLVAAALALASLVAAAGASAQADPRANAASSGETAPAPSSLAVDTPAFCSPENSYGTFRRSTTLTLAGSPGDSVRVLITLRGGDGGASDAPEPRTPGGRGATVYTPFGEDVPDGGVWLPTGSRLDVYVGQAGGMGGGGGGTALVLDQSLLVAVAGGGNGAHRWGRWGSHELNANPGGRGFGPNPSADPRSGGGFNAYGRPKPYGERAEPGTLTGEGGPDVAEYYHNNVHSG